MKIKTSEAAGPALDWLVAKCEGVDYRSEAYQQDIPFFYRDDATAYSSDWAQGGPIIERENITLIRADDEYGVDEEGYTTDEHIPQWFAETSSCAGHSLCTSYESEYMDPTFMIGEADGGYGPTPLIAAMRCFVASKLGEETEIPDNLIDRII